MYELKEPDRIWNRACDEDAPHLRPGDIALAALLKAHGLTMNGGLLHAVECLSSRELFDARKGYRFFGLDEVVVLLEHAESIFKAGDDLECHERILDDEYARLVPDDSCLVERFERHLKSNPADFAAP